MIASLWNRLKRTVSQPPAKDAQLVLAQAQAQARGYRVLDEPRQGSLAVLLEKERAGTIHFWSSDDVVEYGRSKNWV